MSVNPFDLKTVLLAKHAQHVVLIHFPIALFTVAVVFDFLAQGAKSRSLAAAAYFNLMLAASAIPLNDLPGKVRMTLICYAVGTVVDIAIS